MRIAEAKINGMKLFEEISKTSKKNEINDPHLKDFKMETEIRDNKIIVKPFSMRVSGFDADIEGFNTMSGMINYLVKVELIPLTKIKIPFPPDAQKMEKKLRDIGLGSDVDNFIMTLNRGAEDAAKQVKPIFIDAIKKMTITDVTSILKGQPDAATQYLKKTTTTQLQAQFKPIIKTSLDKVNATKYYSDLATKYDKIPFVKKVNPDLVAYTTDLAIQGLFIKIAEEEKNIRANPVARTTDLLKKVFGGK